MRGTTRLAGVVGWPVGPLALAADAQRRLRALGMDWVYVPLAVPPERLAEALRGLPALGFAGVNVTIPHKQAAAALCDELSPDAGRDADR